MVLRMMSTEEPSTDMTEEQQDCGKDLPVDLRKRCVLERETIGDTYSTCETDVKRRSNTFVLASLLQKKSNFSTTQSPVTAPERNNLYTEPNNDKYKVRSELESRLLRPRPSSIEYLDTPKSYGIGRHTYNLSLPEERIRHSSFESQRLNVKRSPESQTLREYLRTDNRNNEQSREQEGLEFKGSGTMHNLFKFQTANSAFRKVGSAERILPTAKSLTQDSRSPELEKEPKEFVPNYRKFYSRCFNKAKSSEKNVEHHHRNLSNLLSQRPEMLDDIDSSVKMREVTILKRSTSCSAVFPKEKLDDTSIVRSHLPRFCGASEPGVSTEPDEPYGDQLRQRLKRRPTLPLRSGPSVTRNDATLRCLLQAPPAEKRIRSQELTMDSENIFSIDSGSEALITMGEENLGGKSSVDDRLKGLPLTDRRVLTPDDYLRAVNKYYLQVLHSFSGLPVLQRLLSDSSSKSLPVPSAGTQTSGSLDSPMSTSPGSDSTSSISTDSGVYSDLAADDMTRKRVSRVLTGKHVRSGTGASLSTLRSLRQMIEERRKVKTLCKP